MIRGLRNLPESVEIAVLKFIREDVGGDGDLIDRLIAHPDLVEIEEGETLLSITSNLRVHVVITSEALNALKVFQTDSYRIGFYPIKEADLVFIARSVTRTSCLMEGGK